MKQHIYLCDLLSARGMQSGPANNQAAFTDRAAFDSRAALAHRAALDGRAASISQAALDNRAGLENRADLESQVYFNHTTCVDESMTLHNEAEKFLFNCKPHSSCSFLHVM